MSQSFSAKSLAVRELGYWAGGQLEMTIEN